MIGRIHFNVRWRHVLRAYRHFFFDSEAGIRHILLAFQHSRWQRRVDAARRAAAGPLADTPLPIDLEALSALPAHTLGGAYARHMVAMGLDAEVFQEGALVHAPIQQRINVQHDIQHLLLGLGVDEPGEVGVAAYAFAQDGDPLNAFVLSHLPLLLLNPQWRGPVWRSLWRGRALGRTTRPVISLPIEELWETPLGEVQRMLGLALD